MSFHFLPALEAEFLGDCSADSAPCAPLKSIPSVGRSSSGAKWMDAYRASLSGTISARLTGLYGEDALTSLPVDSPVRTSAQPERAPESLGNDLDSGPKWREWFAKYIPDTCSWKTPQCSLLADSEPYSETWPRWGTMRNGVCYRHPMPFGITAIRTRQRLTTSGTGSGFSQRCPTPKAEDSQSAGGHRGNPDTLTAYVRCPTMTRADASGYAQVARNPTPGQTGGTTLAGYVRCPTPLEGDAHGSRGSKGKDRPDEGGLAKWARVPTPTASTMTEADMEQARYAGNGGNRPDYQTAKRVRTPDTCRRVGSQDQVGGQLNPDWVEWLCGLPIGWTDLQPLETVKFRQWRRLHGGF